MPGITGEETIKYGKIILIDGSDKCGKETQSKLLVERLIQEGFPCFPEPKHFPRYDTAPGRIIGQCYLGKSDWGEDKAWFGDPDSVKPKVASLYYAADREDAKEEIREIINSGKHLVLDRYVESNMGHQGGKETDPKKRKKMIDFIDNLEYGLLKLPRPDLTVFLYRPYEHILESIKKEGKSDGHESNPGHLKRAEEAYLYLAERYKWKTIKCNEFGNWKTPESIAEEVYGHVKKILKQ